MPEKVFIPDGYVGWVSIEYGIAGAPALPVENGYRIIRIPPGGLLRTSSNPEFGWANDQYYYCNAQDCRELPNTTYGRGGMVWGGYNGTSERPPESPQVHSGFFVGPEEEFSRFANERDSRGDRKTSNPAPVLPTR